MSERKKEGGKERETERKRVRERERVAVLMLRHSDHVSSGRLGQREQPVESQSWHRSGTSRKQSALPQHGAPKPLPILGARMNPTLPPQQMRLSRSLPPSLGAPETTHVAFPIPPPLRHLARNESGPIVASDATPARRLRRDTDPRRRLTSRAADGGASRT